jgi:bud site selection protein 31
VLLTYSFRVVLVEVNEPHEGLRKTESQWPVHQINWQKSRYVYNLYYKYKRISREVFDYCAEQKLIDVALIAKWKKPGYEKLCSTYVINPKNYKFGTVSICRVPKSSLAPGTIIEDPTTGCHGCSSGCDAEENIFGNKYGQDLAGIQVAREERARMREMQQQQEEEEDREERSVGSEEEEEEENLGPVGAADGSSGKTTANIWREDQEEEDHRKKRQKRED